MIAFLVLFENSHFHNVFSTLTNVVKLNVQKYNVVSTLSNVHINAGIHIVDLTLFDVVNSNVETHNAVSTHNVVSTSQIFLSISRK